MDDLFEKRSGIQLIEERRASKAYRIGSRYRKYYKYSTIEQAKYECDMQNIFFSEGIKTPYCYGYGFDQQENMPFYECEYSDFKKIEVRHLEDSYIRNQIIELTDKIADIGLQKAEFINERSYYEDIASSFIYIKDDTDWNEALNDLKNESERCICHGDFSLENLAFDKNGNIILFDYQHVFRGRKGWDLAYLIASLPHDIGEKLVNSIDSVLLQKIQLAAAVKFGRGLIKNYEVCFREENYTYWKEYRL